MKIITQPDNLINRNGCLRIERISNFDVGLISR